MNMFEDIKTLDDVKKINKRELTFEEKKKLEFIEAELISATWTIDDVKKCLENHHNNIKNDYDSNLQELICSYATKRLVDFERIFPNTERAYVRVLTINSNVVDSDTAKHCIYLKGKYIGQIYVDNNGRIFNTINEAIAANGDNVIIITDNVYNHCEFKYVEELDMVAARCQNVFYQDIVDFVYTKDDECAVEREKYKNYNKKWDFSDVKYLLIDKNLSTISTCTKIRYYDAFDFDSNLKQNETVEPVGIMDAFKKLWKLPSGIVNIGGNSYIALDNVENVKKFSNYKAELAHKSGKVQNKIDELVAMKELSPVSICGRLPHQYESMICKTVIARINQNLSVIRWVYNYKDEIFDGMRIYIEGNDVYACKQNNNGEFVRVALSTLNQKNFTSSYSQKIEIDDMSGTRLQYYASIINDIPDDLKMMTLILFLVDPKIEQLVKLGYGETIYHYLRNDKRNLSNVIKKDALINTSGKNINQWLGLNKHQLASFKKYCEDNNFMVDIFVLIGNMKKIFFGVNDISCINDNEFDEAFDAFTYSNLYYKNCFTKDSRYYWYVFNADDVFNAIQNFAQDDEAGVITSNIKKYLPKLFKMCDWENIFWVKYRDTINMSQKMGIHKNIKLYPKTLQELNDTHDSVCAAFNIYEDQIRADGFTKQVEKIKNLAYETQDSDLCVVIPTKPEDLVVEGVELHHCVKSYIDMVALGRTNIVFIRKKDEPTKPFFTVEVSNDKVIRQIHGFGNRNANTEPGLCKFIKKWASNKNIKVKCYS